jgi:ABC-type phosphate transport system substrate-binding protein
MRTSIAGAAFLLVGAGAATVAGAGGDVDGNNLNLNGSDTLYDVTQAVISTCNTTFSDFGANKIAYLGGGSGVGAGAMGLGDQKVSPMSRALKGGGSGEYCAVAGTSPTNASGLLVGVDGVAILANQINSCSTDGTMPPNGVGQVSSAMTVYTDGTVPSGATGAVYTFADSFDALKVLYFGLTNDKAYDCNSSTRKTLIRQWHNLFKTDCAAGDNTCSGGLTHAWRRSDLSGTTDAFVSILNPAKKNGLAVGIGTLPTVPVGATKKLNPFCNSVEAQVAVPTCADPNAVPCDMTFGGSADFSDKDPIKTVCEDTNDGVCELKTVPAIDNNGDLGVVLPVLIPDATTTTATDIYPSGPCGGSCVFVAPAKGANIPSGYRCPSGALPVQGKCRMPFAGSNDPRCVSTQFTKCVGQASKTDGRVYNKVVVINKTQIADTTLRGPTTYQFAFDANFRILDGAYYRIHAQAPSVKYVAETGTTGICAENDDTSQIGCLVDADPCSVGFAGREGAKHYPGSVAANNKALLVKNIAPFPDSNLSNLLLPSGTLYPIARRLYFATLYGWGNLQNGELELAKCYANTTTVNLALNGKFVPIPGGVQCLDYPEQATFTTDPTADTRGTGSVAFGGCGLGGTGTNACASAGVALGLCGNGVTDTTFGEACDPPTVPFTGASGQCTSTCTLVP